MQELKQKRRTSSKRDLLNIKKETYGQQKRPAVEKKERDLRAAKETYYIQGQQAYEQLKNKALPLRETRRTGDLLFMQKRPTINAKETYYSQVTHAKET